MALIRKPNEIKLQTRIKMLVYGQAGTGKTTLGLSAPNPLLIDCDGGISRVSSHHWRDCVQVDTYDQVISVLTNEDLTPYETIVIDTGGRLLDLIGEWLIKNNPKLGRSNGMLTQQGYSTRKAEFTNFCRLINGKGKDIMFIAHRQTQKDGDEVRYVPLFGGSNYDALITELDLVGYVEANGRKRVITFDATDKHDAKNTCNMPPSLEIPTIIDEDGNPTGANNFITREVVQRYRDRLHQRAELGRQYDELMVQIKTDIEAITDAQGANAFVFGIDDYQHVGNSKIIAGRMLMQQAKAQGIEYDAKAKEFK